MEKELKKKEFKKREPTPTAKPVKPMVEVTFRDHRKFDLHVRREVITFNGRESKIILKELTTHADFLQVKDYFIVKEV